MAAKPAVPPGTSLLELLAQGRQLRALGLNTKEIASKLGMKPTSYRSANAIYVATSDPDPRIAALAKQALEDVDRSGHIDAAYKRVRQARNGPVVVNWRDQSLVRNSGRMTDVIPRGLNALQALAIGFDRYTAQDLALVHPDTLAEWAEAAREFRATLFQFIKRTEEAHGRVD